MKRLSSTSYSEYEKRCGESHNRKCIDGTITGCGKCVAFCRYWQHPGYLTDKLRNEHKCVEKGCFYYISKSKHKNPKKSLSSDDCEKRVIEAAELETYEMEGVRIMNAVQSEDSGWTVYYVAIADYELEVTSEAVSERVGIKVQFQKLDYEFEIAANLVMNKKRKANCS